MDIMSFVITVNDWNYLFFFKLLGTAHFSPINSPDADILRPIDQSPGPVEGAYLADIKDDMR